MSNDIMMIWLETLVQILPSSPDNRCEDDTATFTLLVQSIHSHIPNVIRAYLLLWSAIYAHSYEKVWLHHRACHRIH